MDEPIGSFKPRVAPKRKPRSHLVYSRAAWKRTRKAQLQRQPICQHCKTQLANEVDHIDGDNTNNDRSNLQSLCARCHGIKTQREDNNTD